MEQWPESGIIIEIACLCPEVDVASKQKGGGGAADGREREVGREGEEGEKEGEGGSDERGGV